jgi:hypothetical protein
MENCPEGLIAAVAKNILAKRNRQPALATFQKEASAENQDAINQFLAQNDFAPGDFIGDPAADKMVSPLQNQTNNQIRGYFNSQAQLMGGMTHELKKNQQLALRQLQEQSGQARIRSAIIHTMGAQAQDPAQFGQMVDLSSRSHAAFDHSHLADMTAAAGGLGGGIGGALLGKSKVGKVGLGALGALGGGLGGLLGGRKAEERQTGYSHGDVLKPYEVADRLERRHKTDAKVK